MLLPSALSCDSSHPPAATRLQAALFASPPASPPALSTQNAFGSIFNTCRSLQSLIATPPTASPAPMTQLPTPPMSHAAPPLKLRLRSRSKPEGGEHLAPRKRIVKRAPPRGANKRRRTAEDDMGRDDVEDDAVSDLEISAGAEEDIPRPSTPKRARIAPEVVPLGLERSDYHDLHVKECAKEEDPSSSTSASQVPQSKFEMEEWSTEDDRILVELVLEKLKLSKTDWQDCARSLGKDRHSVGKRWKSLMVNGDVGLKTRSSRRAKLHSTWR